MYRWIVSQEESGLTLLEFLKKKLDADYSNRKIKEAIEYHQCTINGKIERFSGTFLGRSDRISIALREKIAFEIERLIYEDQNLFVYNKPPFIASTDEKGRGLDALLKKERPSLIPIHRLDRDTSGIILFAKNQKYYERLIGFFKNFQIKKTYLAIVCGVPKQSQGIVEKNMKAVKKDLGATLWGIDSQGVYSKTHWNLLAKGKEGSIIKCQPITGRTHQIRVHLSYLGLPILGDMQYGKNQILHREVPRIMLHAYSIEFPTDSGDILTFQARIPLDFQNEILNLKIPAPLII